MTTLKTMTARALAAGAFCLSLGLGAAASQTYTIPGGRIDAGVDDIFNQSNTYSVASYQPSMAGCSTVSESVVANAIGWTCAQVRAHPQQAIAAANTVVQTTIGQINQVKPLYRCYTADRRYWYPC